ncbi:MAG: patatin-like phospholipase family protein [Deltaproteobacteria bacterium]|nr:patatin-like phospholipase family protein [Deltaproteobacteria bacterium]
MGITIVQKSDLSKKKPHAKLALVLAGGAITGATFKVGGLKALNDFLVNKKVTDFDIYVGVSAGSLLATPIAGGIGPEELLKSLDGSSDRFSQISPFDLYRPNFGEFFERPLSFLYRRATYLPGIFYDSVVSLPKLWGHLRDGVARFIHKPSYSNFEGTLRPLAKLIYSDRALPSFSESIPSGLFDNRKIESYLRKNLKRNRLPNSFKAFQRKRGNSLYVVAMDLDSGERVIFGPDAKHDLTISEAVQASTALPFFYKPARIKGVDYLDGGVRRTTNMDVAIGRGAELIICYNPFGPYSNQVVLEYLREEDEYVTRNRRLSSMGIMMIFNQVFRTVFHTRIRYFMDQMRADPSFKGDIILIEPKEDDRTFFEMNPFSFWNRAHAAMLGFSSVRQAIEENWGAVSKILASYGIQMTRDLADLDYEKMIRSTSDDATIMNVLEEENPFPQKPLRLVHRA